MYPIKVTAQIVALGYWMPSMRKLLYILLIFVAGAASALINDVIIFNLWFYFGGWRKSVTNWLFRLGYEGLAAYWAFVWHRIPDWFVAFASGLILGIIIRKNSRWLRTAIVFTFGFFLVPELI
ncbi:hypothetical protein ACFL1G_08700 [Planctomycetota bacterium]